MALKPGIQKAYLSIYSNNVNAWYVVRDVVNGDVFTLLTENYHINLFCKITNSDKNKHMKKQQNITFTVMKGIRNNINISLGFVDFYGAIKTKKIKSFPYNEKTFQRMFFVSGF